MEEVGVPSDGISKIEVSCGESESSVESKKEKKSKKPKKEKNVMSESEASTSDGSAKKNKKHKKKHKKSKHRGESEFDTEEGRKRHKHRKKRSSSADKPKLTKFDAGPVIEKRAARKQGPGGMDPMEWSREDLLEKVARFGVYEIDRESGCGSFKVEGKRMLGEEIKVALELLRRNTETQFVTFKKCFMTDETFAALAEGIRGLRHVKRLNLAQNALTRDSVMLIIAMFKEAIRTLQHLDLRDNLVNESDIRACYYAFPTIHSLNGVNIMTLKSDSDDKSYTLCDKQMTITEIAVVCCVLKRYIYLDTLDISRNVVNSDCLELLAETLLPLRNIKTLIMKFNPLTNGGENMTGIKAFMEMLRVNRSILHVSLDGGKVPAHIAENIERSLMVNRCISKELRGDFTFSSLLFLAFYHFFVFVGCVNLVCGVRHYVQRLCHKRDSRSCAPSAEDLLPRLDPQADYRRSFSKLQAECSKRHECKGARRQHHPSS